MLVMIEAGLNDVRRPMMDTYCIVMVVVLFRYNYTLYLTKKKKYENVNKTLDNSVADLIFVSSKPLGSMSGPHSNNLFINGNKTL